MANLDELTDYLAWERKQSEPAFYRCETRKRRLKTRLDCGHVIDGSEPYRYQVWKTRGERGVHQRTDCEFCARVDAKG